MLHAAGLRHENSRKDRDEYIRLIKENLGYMIHDSNFAKADTLDRNPYDYESIMQYGLNVRTLAFLIFKICVRKKLVSTVSKIKLYC